MWKRKKTDFDWLVCREPYSFYHQFMTEYWEGGPSEELAACLHRLCTLGRKMEVASFVVEEGIGRADIDEEIAHLNLLAPAIPGTVRASVITFLRIAPRRDKNVALIMPADVIGQFTIISFPRPDGPRSYIFEAVHRLPSRKNKLLLNNLVSLRGLLAVAVGGRAIRIPAAYFCQQNGVTSICAHSAVRTLVRTQTDAPVSVAWLNQFWNYAPGGSVTTVQLLEALRTFGLNVTAYKLPQMPVTPFERHPDNVWRLLAMLADSGSSSLLIFSSGVNIDHVVPVVGHTVNTDEWHPIGASLHVNGQARESSNSQWIDHLVIHDDMLGPYYCLSRAALFPAETEDPLNIHFAIAIFPKGAHMSPQQAESVCRESLNQLIDQCDDAQLGRGNWWDFLCKSFERRIFRTILIDRKTYLDSLRQQMATREDEKDIRKLGRRLPELMWMCELSLPNLFLANRAKLGEILIDATAQPAVGKESEAIQCFRLPSLLGWADGPKAFAVRTWPVVRHVPMHAPLQHSEQW